MNGDSEDPELGPPIAELAQLIEEPRRGFIERIQSSIDRRRLGSQMTGLAWNGVALVVIELLAMLMSLFGGAASSDSSNDRDPTA